MTTKEIQAWLNWYHHKHNLRPTINCEDEEEGIVKFMGEMSTRPCPDCGGQMRLEYDYVCMKYTCVKCGKIIETRWDK